MTPKRWFAVWNPESDEDGSWHVKATSKRAAIRKYRSADPGLDDEYMSGLVASEVSDAVHRIWEDSNE